MPTLLPVFHGRRRFGAVLVFYLVVLLAATGLGGRRSAAAAQPLTEWLPKIPLAFVENRGQAASEIRYLVTGRDKSVFFTDRGLAFRLSKTTPERRARSGSGLEGRTRPDVGERSNAPSVHRSWTVALDFAGAARPVQPVGEEDTGTTYSYFRGSEAGGIHSGVRGYRRLVYRELWPGVDLVYRGTQDRLKYEFVVQPGADASAIRLRYRGAERVEMGPDGRLTIETPVANFHDERPDVFQNGEEGRTSVEAGYQILDREADGGVEFGFRLGDYDRTRPLIIDPVVLIYCGYVGGSGADQVLGVAADSEGYAYITGSTSSSPATFPAVAGPVLTENGQYDAFVAKLRPDGMGFVYCGFIGGPGWDFGHDVAVDAQGNAYVAGSTMGGLPVAVGPDLIYNGGRDDAFVAKVDPTGASLTYCGYIGGSDDEQAYALAVDGSGCVYAVGVTRSSAPGFPVRTGPDLSFNGIEDAFIAKVQSDGSGLHYAGYIGGTSTDNATDVAVDGAGRAFVCGYTGSKETSFPIVAGPILTAPGHSDGFVCKLSPSGSQLLYSGFLGGTGPDMANGIAVDPNGVAYVCGSTASGISFPRVGGPGLTPNGAEDAFLTRVQPNGVGYVSSGLLGGHRDDVALSVALDAAGAIYLAGYTYSDATTFPPVHGWGPLPLGDPDAFILKLRPDALGVEFSTYLGGRMTDFASELAVNPLGEAFVAGLTGSTETTFPLVAGPQLTFGGGPFEGVSDGFLARIRTHPTAPPELHVAPAAEGRALVDWTDLNVNRTGFELERKVDGGEFVPRAAQTGAIFTDSQLTSGVGYTYRVRAVNSVGVSPYSNPVRIVALNGPPTPPANLQAVALGSTVVQVAWTDTNAGQADTRIERAIGSGAFELRTTLAPAAVTYQDTGLVKNTQYHYRVFAVSSQGLSAPSNTATVTTPLDPPPAPSGLVAQLVDAARIDLSWIDNSTTETAFKLERAVNGGLATPLAEVGANVTSYSDGALQPGTTYRYSVRSVAATGESARATSAPVTVPLPPPNAPANLQAQALSTALIALTWIDTNSGQAETRVRRSVNDGVFAEVASLPPGTSAWEDSAVHENTHYRYQVTATTSGGTSPVSNVASVSTPLNPPAAPSALTAQASGGTRIDLAWTDHSQTESGFKIERSTSFGPVLPLTEVGANVTTYSDSTVLAGVTYRYAVKARNAGGESSRAFSAVVTVILPPPYAPQGLQVEVVSSRSVRVSWKDTSDNESGFRLLRKVEAGEFTAAATLTASTTAYADAVQPTTTYIYRVVAYNDGGDSAPATSSPVTTPKDGKLTVTPARLTFPMTKPGKTAKKVVTVKNTGAGPLPVQLGTIAAPFARAVLPESQFTLAPRASRQVTITFTPTAAGSASATLTVASDVKTVSVSISGRGR